MFSFRLNRIIDVFVIFNPAIPDIRPLGGYRIVTDDGLDDGYRIHAGSRQRAGGYQPKKSRLERRQGQITDNDSSQTSKQLSLYKTKQN